MAVGTVQRAYQLAPECKSVAELHQLLVQEGCPNVAGYLQGALLRELEKLVSSNISRIRARTGAEEQIARREQSLDHALEETFPASDPPAALVPHNPRK